MKFEKKEEETEQGLVMIQKSEDFSIAANKLGISFQGVSVILENRKDLDAFAKAVSDAWRDHIRLKAAVKRLVFQ